MQKLRLLPTLPSLLSTPQEPLIHRDLSWLQFNERVLEEARAASGNPLLERVKFLAITASNLDEFFMIRLASIGRTIKSSNRLKVMNRASVRRLQLIRGSILETVAKFNSKQSEVLDILVAELHAAGIHLVRNASESDAAFELGRRVFEQQVFPKLSPPETFDIQKVSLLENLQLGVIFTGGLWFKIPRNLPSLLCVIKEGETPAIYFYFLDNLLESYLGPTFGLRGAAGLVRLTRDADFTLEVDEEDPESIPDMVRTSLGTREKGAAVRLQYAGDISSDLLEQMGGALKLLPGQISPAPQTVLLHGLWQIVKDTPEAIASRTGFRYPPLTSKLPKFFETGDNMFDMLKQSDFLLHHPYDSFDAYVSWIRSAAQDPKVMMIEQTVYRVDLASPLVAALKEAASRKRVRVIIELRARFDEFNNLRLADELRKAGVEVAYGFGKLKLHAKVALVTRSEEDGVKLYTHLSTGNYNATTARTYTDLAILTANPEIGADARLFFDSACRGEVPQGFKQMVSAPTKLHRRLLSLIQAETAAAQKGLKTRIVAKVNALVDETVIDALYKASQAGVHVDLIVRGACSLIPGVKGLSENIHVVSIVDRFLEHSRIYYFESSKAMYLSSADWMPRNFFSRLEIAFPVLDERLYSYIEKVVIPTYLSDNVKARELTHQGTWKRKNTRFGQPAIRSQFVFETFAAGEYDGTPLKERFQDANNCPARPPEQASGKGTGQRS